MVPEQFPENPAPDTESRWPCMCHGPNQNASVMIDGKSFREIDSRSWDTSRRIEDMDALGITRQALSPMPELLSYWFEPAVGQQMCRWINQTIAQAVAIHPNRFSGLGCVPMQDPALAARDLSRIKSDGLSGVEIGSNISGIVLGDSRFDEFYAEAERLDLAIFVHALHPIGADRLKLTPDLIPFAAFPLDTALSAISLIRAGVPEKYPKLRLGFSHGGGAIIPLAHRLGQGAKLTGNFNQILKKTPAEYASTFFYDNLVYDVGYFSYLANEFAPGHVCCGTDYPYAIMEKAPQFFIEEAQLQSANSVRYEAAQRFLFGKQLQVADR